MQSEAAPPRLVELHETASTNADALRLALSNEPLPLWVIARRQTAGRGRSGRAWMSQDGNLFASVAINCRRPLVEAGQLALVAGVAIIEAIADVAPAAKAAGLRLKWPNDILIGRAKAGGILVESTASQGAEVFTAVVGFGLNVNAAPQMLDREAASLRQSGIDVTLPQVIEALAGSFARWHAIWEGTAGFETVRAAWLSNAGPPGEAITVQGPNGPLDGIFLGLDSSGALLAAIDGRPITVTYGDVTLRDERQDPRG